MQVTTSNLNVNTTMLVGRLTTNNIAIDPQSISFSGTPTVNSSQIAVGNVSVTPIGITTPLIFIGGASFGPGTAMGIVNAQFFTANGTWVKPTNINNSDTRNQVLIMAWGAGGAGRNNANTSGAGGGGGACVTLQLPLSSLDSTCPVTIGLGALSANGGNTTFVVNSSSTIIAYGGQAATADATPGGGGGTLSNGSGANGGSPLGGDATNTSGSTFGGGRAGLLSTVSNSVFGGGGGGAGDFLSGIRGGTSVFGGGGGSRNGGTSILGGQGGLFSLSVFYPPTAPGGGGCAGDATASVGARGEVRVWVIGPGPLS